MACPLLARASTTCSISHKYLHIRAHEQTEKLHQIFLLLRQALYCFCTSISQTSVIEIKKPPEKLGKLYEEQSMHQTQAWSSSGLDLCFW